jgi:hypothetical protein
MDPKFTQISHMTDALERELLEQELRSMAQRAAAEAIARGVRQLFAKVRSLIAGARPASKAGLHSA